MWKIIKFRPLDISLNNSTEWCYGLFRKEDPGVGRVMGPETEMCKNGVHRFAISSSGIQIVGDFPDVLTRPTDLLTILNEKSVKLELPSLDKMKNLIPEEFDLNNELSDEELSDLISYSNLRKLAIKQQIYIQSVNELLYGDNSVSNDDGSQNFVKPISPEKQTVTKAGRKPGPGLREQLKQGTTVTVPPGWNSYTINAVGSSGTTASIDPITTPGQINQMFFSDLLAEELKNAKAAGKPYSEFYSEDFGIDSIKDLYPAEDSIAPSIPDMPPIE